MKRGNLEKWENVSACNNLLFFSQLVNELLFDYSIPSNRISTLNTHYLCLDALSAIESIDYNGVPEGTLKPIMEELHAELKKDPVFTAANSPLDYFVKYQNDKYTLCSRIADMGYRELKNTANAIHNSFFKDNNYYNQLKKRITEVISNNREEDQQILFRMTKSLLTELMNTGYSLRYLYMMMNRLFWEPKRQITSPDSINAFFDSFNFQRKKYKVIFKVDKNRIEQFISFIDDLNCLEELPEDIHQRIEKPFTEKKKREAFLVIDQNALDPFDAAERAIDLLEINTSVYRLYDHRYRYNISNADCVILEDDFTYKYSRSLKAVEHTKKPSSKEIREGMDIANDAIQNIAKAGDYYDYLSVLSAIQYHSHSLDSYSEENQLLDLWAIFESVLDISNKHTTDRIQQICMHLVPLLKHKYIYSLFKQLSDDIKNYDEALFSEIVGDVNVEADIVRLTCEFVLLDEYKEKREAVLSNCHEFPLLQERISYYCEMLKTPALVNSFVEKHAERVRWQIMRIYRNRNLIIHNGSSMPYLSLLIALLAKVNAHFLLHLIWQTS